MRIPTLESGLGQLRGSTTNILARIAKIAYGRPIYSIIVFALLASSSYTGLLYGIFATETNESVDLDLLYSGAKDVWVGPGTAWKWRPYPDGSHTENELNRLVLLTFLSQDRHIDHPTQPGELITDWAKASNVSLTSLPSGRSTGFNGDAALATAFIVPFDSASELLLNARSLPDQQSFQHSHSHPPQDITATAVWTMRDPRRKMDSDIVTVLRNGYDDFLHLVRHAEAVDVLIMTLEYVATLLTFAALFDSMRKLGSRFWLAANVMLSSLFAFLFGLFTAHKLGVPLTWRLLAEGLPFLIVTVGFEQYTVLTRAVLTHDGGQMRAKSEPIAAPEGTPHATGHDRYEKLIETAIQEHGWSITRDYAMKIAVLVTGAAAGVRGGLSHFCNLAAWILCFDCAMLFTFYTAVLRIKVEVNRIRKQLDTRDVLTESGVSADVAAEVAQAEIRLEDAKDGRVPTTSVQLSETGSTHIPRFKILMMVGFCLVNIFNLCSVGLRSGDLSSWTLGLGGAFGPPPIDPFKVAPEGLNTIRARARTSQESVAVTVMPPIEFKLEAVQLAVQTTRLDGSSRGRSCNTDSIGQRDASTSSILASLEDPILSKWVIAALCLSLALNGFLFSAATTASQEPRGSQAQLELARLVRATPVTDTDKQLPEQMQRFDTPLHTLTPDESETSGRVTPSAQGRDGVDEVRSEDALQAMLQQKLAHQMTDEELVDLCLRGRVPGHALERVVGDYTRAVQIRRKVVARTAATQDLTSCLERSDLPYKHYNWSKVLGACCENVIGYVPMPVGLAGPLLVDGKSLFVPMATTEGMLVASTSRGCKAINLGGGTTTILTADGMTRGPCIGFGSLDRVGAAKKWLDSAHGQALLKRAFDSTSRFARLQSIKTAVAGTQLFLRFRTTTGDAMGMNMISKGVEHALKVMRDEDFDDMTIVSVSGNYCTDKKPAAVNWIEGRGKGVVAEALIPAAVVQSVLKTDIDSLVELNTSKNLIGSAMAGAIGGFNAHAANMVAAIFIATGQDPAQVVESANCITIMRRSQDNLHITVSMPSIEVGTLGGGTILDAQAAMLEMLGVRGPHPTNPGSNAQQLARIVAALVLAGELSTCSALAAGHLVNAHLQGNRSAALTPTQRSVT